MSSFLSYTYEKQQLKEINKIMSQQQPIVESVEEGEETASDSVDNHEGVDEDGEIGGEDPDVPDHEELEATLAHAHVNLAAFEQARQTLLDAVTDGVLSQSGRSKASKVRMMEWGIIHTMKIIHKIDLILALMRQLPV
jgi:hypothetical protein